MFPSWLSQVNEGQIPIHSFIIQPLNKLSQLPEGGTESFISFFHLFIFGFKIASPAPLQTVWCSLSANRTWLSPSPIIPSPVPCWPRPIPRTAAFYPQAPPPLFRHPADYPPESLVPREGHSAQIPPAAAVTMATTAAPRLFTLENLLGARHRGNELNEAVPRPVAYTGE